MYTKFELIVSHATGYASGALKDSLGKVFKKRHFLNTDRLEYPPQKSTSQKGADFLRSKIESNSLYIRQNPKFSYVTDCLLVGIHP